MPHLPLQTGAVLLVLILASAAPAAVATQLNPCDVIYDTGCTGATGGPVPAANTVWCVGATVGSVHANDGLSHGGKFPTYYDQLAEYLDSCAHQWQLVYQGTPPVPTWKPMVVPVMTHEGKLVNTPAKCGAPGTVAPCP